MSVPSLQFFHVMAEESLQFQRVLDIYSVKNWTAIHGYILTAWAIVSLAGPLLLSLFYDSTKSYELIMMILVYYSS